MAVVIALQDRVSTPTPLAPAEALAETLLHARLVSPHDMVEALRLHRMRGGRLADILLARGLVEEEPLFQVLSKVW